MDIDYDVIPKPSSSTGNPKSAQESLQDCTHFPKKSAEATFGVIGQPKSASTYHNFSNKSGLSSMFQDEEPFQKATDFGINSSIVTRATEVFPRMKQSQSQGDLLRNQDMDAGLRTLPLLQSNPTTQTANTSDETEASRPVLILSSGTRPNGNDTIRRLSAESFSASPAQELLASSSATSESPTISESWNLPRAPPDSWARVAATVKPPAAPPTCVTPITISSSESSQEQMRVVWIAHLPSTTTLLDISCRIDVGPIMSLGLYNDISPQLPGRSACLIFQTAETAATFVSRAPQAFVSIIPTKTKPVYGAVATKPHPAVAIYSSEHAFPLDADLLSMSAPTFARRRIKWSRARLFHDVPLAKFKKDLRDVVGVDNLELVHFYNPGEATAVFASVCVAARAVQWFREQAKTSGGRYEGVDVAFVHDFNEAPAKLHSQYGKDGKVKKLAVTIGVEGLFSGPP